ncbi:GNAT family N-acetyltransferase [Actinokineospora soli]|uniref:GNAT family N-acetyltransferase n=1 Tax=Actinokineospora soli TaxID=1048753 RepID=A0ABW2TPS2_9PSEU
MTPRIRQATPADAESIATIWRTGWTDAHLGNVPDDLVAARTPETFTTRAADRAAGKDSATTLVAEVDGAIAGFVMVLDDEVEQVYVDARHRGRGIAAPLLSAAEAAIRDHGHPTAWLAVVPGNRPARHFYERQGWQDTGPYDHHAPGGFIVPVHKYVKDLTTGH